MAAAAAESSASLGAFTFDADRFRTQLEALPHFTYIGCSLHIQYKAGDNSSNNNTPEFALHGLLGDVTKDLLVLHHCALAPTRSGPPHNSSDDTSLPADAHLASRVRGLPNATIQRKNVTLVDPLDDTVVLPRRTSSAGDLLDAQMFGRRLAILRALHAIPESTSDFDWLATHGVALVSIRSCDNSNSNSSGGGSLTQQDLEQLKGDLAKNVNECYRLMQLAGGGGGGGGGVGAAGGRGGGGLLGLDPDTARALGGNAFGEEVVRAVLRTRRADMAQYCSFATYFLALASSSGLAFSGYLWVVLSGSSRVLSPVTFGLRLLGIGFHTAAVLLSIGVSHERTHLLELRTSACRWWLRYIWCVLCLPAAVLLIALCGSLEATGNDFLLHKTLQVSYSESLDDMCSFFKINECSGFDDLCGTNGTVCPSDCRRVDVFTKPCRPEMQGVLTSMARPLLVITCLTLVAIFIQMVFQWRLDLLVDEIIGVVRPQPPTEEEQMQMRRLREQAQENLARGDQPPTTVVATTAQADTTTTTAAVE